MLALQAAKLVHAVGKVEVTWLCMLSPDVGGNPVAAAPSTAQQSVDKRAQAAPPGRSASAGQGQRHPDGPRHELHRVTHWAALSLSPGRQEDPQHCPLDNDSHCQQQSPNQQHLQGQGQDGLSACCLADFHFPSWTDRRRQVLCCQHRLLLPGTAKNKLQIPNMHASVQPADLKHRQSRVLPLGQAMPVETLRSKAAAPGRKIVHGPLNRVCRAACSRLQKKPQE